jgi:hypothetical protein
MKAANKVAVGLILVGAAAIAGVNIGRYLARANLFGATSGFSGERAFNDLRQLVELGPRPPGSQALHRAREYISRQLSAAGAEVRDDSFVGVTPVGNISMNNVVGTVQGESPTVVILAGHYDTAKLDGVQFVGQTTGAPAQRFFSKWRAC